MGTELEDRLESIGGDVENNQWRIYGPPGTGKTYYASRQVERAVEKYGSNQVLACSFTKAAAVELASRTLLDREQLGTLHAHCYRALGRPTIAETKYKEWNERYPQFQMGGGGDGLGGRLDDNEEAAGNAVGDEMLAKCSLYRNLCMSFDAWFDPAAQHFYKHFWRPWKEEHGWLDFTDLLEHAARDIKIAPGSPSVLLVDEAQDSSRLQLKIIHNWGRHCDYYLTIGDDDQTLYIFTGATPDAFLDPELPAGRNIVLSQSHRVPRRIHAMADRWIQRVQHRHPKLYRPTAEEGEIAWEDAVFRDRNGQRTEYDKLLDGVEADLGRGKTVMILASCSYLLGDVRKEIMRRGIPFHNPYRRRRGDWNPLRMNRGTSAADRVIAFLQAHHDRDDSRPWTGLEHKLIAQWLMAAGTFRTGMKAQAIAAAPDAPITEEQLEQWYEEKALDELITALGDQTMPESLQWWIGRLLKDHVKTAQYPARIVARQGLDGLQKTPQLTLGTIHSVKGGEADVVYLFPDVSPQGMQNWLKPADTELHESIVRQFYVGLTRARQKLVICQVIYQGMNVFVD